MSICRPCAERIAVVRTPPVCREWAAGIQHRGAGRPAIVDAIRRDEP